jgi:hypothetical protein
MSCIVETWQPVLMFYQQTASQGVFLLLKGFCLLPAGCCAPAGCTQLSVVGSMATRGVGPRGPCGCGYQEGCSEPHVCSGTAVLSTAQVCGIAYLSVVVCSIGPQDLLKNCTLLYICRGAAAVDSVNMLTRAIQDHVGAAPVVHV